MSTPWQFQHDYIHAHEAQHATTARRAQQLADWRHATGRLSLRRRLRLRHRLLDWFRAGLRLATHERHVEGVRAAVGLGREVAGVGRG
jgi:hypothetical protein